MIVLDAGRPDYISLNLGSMPNMRALLQHAHQYDRAWVGDLMSITRRVTRSSAAVPSPRTTAAS
jgi:hypothetical protein